MDIPSRNMAGSLVESEYYEFEIILRLFSRILSYLDVPSLLCRSNCSATCPPSPLIHTSSWPFQFSQVGRETVRH